MKKTTTIEREKNVIDYIKLCNNTANIHSNNGKNCLYNVKTNSYIGEMDFWSVNYNDRYCIESKEYGDKYLVNVWDSLEEKYICKKYESEANPKIWGSLLFLKSPDDGSIHVYDNSKFDENIFNLQLDSAATIYRAETLSYAILTKGNKKGLYKKGVGLIKPIEYDDIEIIDDVVIFTKNGKKQFSLFDCFGKISKKYDDITLNSCKIDTSCYYWIMCKCKNMIDVYKANFDYSGHKKHIITPTFSIEADDITSGLEMNFNSNMFIASKNGKYGLLEYNQKLIQQMDYIYDAIIKKEDEPNFYGIKDNKMDVYTGFSKDFALIFKDYNDVIYLGYDYFAVSKDKNYDIVRVTDDNKISKTIITDISIEKNKRPESDRIYSKNGKYGLISFYRLDLLNPILKYKDAVYDEVKCVDKKTYIVKKDNKYGIIFKCHSVVEPIYDEIEVKNEHLWSNKSHFVLKKDGKYELKTLSNDKLIDFDDMMGKKFNIIKLYNDIIVLKDDDNTYIYNYSHQLLYKMLGDIEVEEVRIEDEICYLIDGIYYIRSKSGSFQEVIIEETDFFVTRYELDDECYEVKSDNKETHDLFCSEIEDLIEKGMNEVLQKMDKKPRLGITFNRINLKK